MKAPKNIQIAIKRVLYHSRVYKKNVRIVDEWFRNNNIDRKIPLASFIEEKPKKVNCIEGQMNIFDYLID